MPSSNTMAFVSIAPEVPLITSLNSTSSFEEFFQPPPEGYNWLILFLLPLILCSMLGNILVILALILERKLQNSINYFLQSLAVADLMVSLLVMPLGLVNDLIGYWPFGQIMCNIWATLDVLNCTASILHMCVMSVERYLAICHPLFHRKRRHSCFQKVGIKIALVWLISIFLSSLLFTLGQVIPEAVYLDRACRVQHVYFQVYGSIFAFFIPLAIVVISYMMTAIKLLQKSRAYDGTLTNATRVGKLTRRAHSLRQFILENGKIPEEDTSAQHSELMPLSPTASLERSKSSVSIRVNHSSYKVSTTSSSTPNRNGSQMHREGRRGSAPPLCLCQDRHSKRRKQKRVSPKSSFKTNSLRSNLSSSSMNANSVHVSKEHQANIVLGLVFACFVISWAPFFILNIYFALCETCSEADPTLMQFFEWLGWASSLINPFIYTAFNQTFRRTFWRLLRCHCLWGQRRRARWNSQNREQVRTHGEQAKGHVQCNHNNSTCV